MANTFSSRNTLKTKLLAAINAANSADMIVKLSRTIEKANLDDDADLETALDTKVSALAGTASTEDIEKLAFGVKKLRTPEGAGVPTSSMVAEGSSNLYVTQDRVRGSFSAAGDLSYDSGTGVLSYTALPDALTVYATVADLPSSGVAAGSKGIVEENKRLYVFTGASWVGVGLVDQKPSFDSNPDGSYALTPGGDTVITLSATDPQGDPITFSHVVSAGSLGGTTVSQADNVFTITGSTNPADTAPFSITFRASDGTNVADTTPSEFTISFGINWNNLSYSLTISGKPANYTSRWGRLALQIDDGKIVIDDQRHMGSNGDNMGKWWVYDRVGTQGTTDLSTNSLSNGALGYDFNNAIHSANDWDNNWSYINDMYPYFAYPDRYPDNSMLIYGTQRGKMRDGYYFAGHIFGMDGSTGRFGGINGYDISTGEPRFSLGNPESHSYFGHPSRSGNDKYEINKYEWGRDFDVILNHPTLGYNVAVVGTSSDHGNSLRTPTEDTPRLDYKVQGKLYVMQFAERGASSNPTSSCVRTIWNERARAAGRTDPEFAKGSRGQGGSASAIAISPTTSQVAVGANQAGGGSDQVTFEATNTIHDYNTNDLNQPQTFLDSGRILVYNLETGDLQFDIYHTQTYPHILDTGQRDYGGRFGSSVYAEDDGFISLSCLEGRFAVGGQAIIIVSKFSWTDGSEIWTWKNTDEPGNSALNSSSSNIVYDVKDGAMAIWHNHANGYLWVLDTSTGTLAFGGDSNQDDAHAVGVGDGTVLIGKHNGNMTRFDVD